MMPIRSGIRRAFHLTLGRRAAIEAELREELEMHVAMRARQLEQAGMDPESAKREAIRRFDSFEETQRELTRTAKRREGQMRFTRFLEASAQDFTFVARQLLRSPALTLTVVVTLALGIGANALMFGVLDALLFRPPEGVIDPARLGRFGVQHNKGNDSWRQSSLAYATFRDLRDSRLVGGVAAYSFPQSYSLGRGANAAEATGVLVSPSYFTVLGTTPAAGRFFSESDGAEPVGSTVAVISHGLWQRMYGGQADAVGRRLNIAGREFTIIGVAPRRFSGYGSSSADIWIPISSGAGLRAFDSPEWMTTRTTQWLGILVRVPARLPEDSLSLGALHRNLTQVFRAGEASNRYADSTATVRITSSLRTFTAKNSSDVKVARLLMGVSIFVLLIACANVGNLLLARSVKRQQEIAIRIALGISRARLVYLLFIETVMLAVLGGAASMLFVHWAGTVVAVRFLGQTPGTATGMVDFRVLAFAGVATLAVTLLVGLVPATQGLRSSLADSVKSGGRSGPSRRQRRTATSLLLAQVALCTTLLIGTGLFLRSLSRLNDLRLGIDTREVLIAEMDMKSVGKTPDEIAATFLRLGDRVRAVPGVRSASVAMGSPLGSSFGAEIKVPGLEKLPTTDDGGPYINAVDEHYFATLGTRLVRGRGFNASDRRPNNYIVIVNESMARRFWPGQNPLGKCVKVGGDTVPCSSVIGVVENSRRQKLLEGESFQYFVPLESGPANWRGRRTIFARVSQSPEAMTGVIRRAMQSEGADLPFARVRPMHALLDDDFRPWKLGSTMFSLFGTLALILAVVGLYGSLAYDIAQRRRELSVRMALGAQQRDIVGLVLRHGGAIVAAGLLIGGLGAFAGSRWIRGLLYEVSPRDPWVFAGVGLTILLAGLCAAVIPARRASSVDIRESLVSD